MKKFKFSLQSLLDVRSKLEEEQKNKLSLAASEYQKVLQKKSIPLTKIENSRQQIRQSMLDHTVSISELRQLDVLRNQAEKLAFSLEPEIEDKFQKMEEERKKYLKLHQDKRAIEILKEKEIAQYKQNFAKAEQRVMDEISKHQHLKNQ